jgi:hypothetical protein
MSNLDQPTQVISCEGHAKAVCLDAVTGGNEAEALNVGSIAALEAVSHR